MSRKTLWFLLGVVVLYYLYTKTTYLNFLKSKAQVMIQKADTVASITAQIQALVNQANAETDPIKKQALALQIPPLIQKLSRV